MISTPSFELLESILWRPPRGYYLLRRHAARLRRSARHFGFRLPAWTAIRRASDDARFGMPAVPVKLRLLIRHDGRITVTAAPLPTTGAGDRPPWRVVPAQQPVNWRDPFLRHKTTQRTVYEHARAARPEADDVLLWNPWGDVTETTIANVLFKFGTGPWVTPAAVCGLLPGVYRAHLLAAERIREAVIPLERVLRCRPSMILINSVRRDIPAVLEPAGAD